MSWNSFRVSSGGRHKTISGFMSTSKSPTQKKVTTIGAAAAAPTTAAALFCLGALIVSTYTVSGAATGFKDSYSVLGIGFSVFPSFLGSIRHVSTIHNLGEPKPRVPLEDLVPWLFIEPGLQ